MLIAFYNDIVFLRLTATLNLLNKTTVNVMAKYSFR